MSDEIYKKLAKILDTLPSGFPQTEEGIEIRILKKIFTPDEAGLFCDLKITPETAEEISLRTGRPLEGLEDKLVSMWKRGEVWGSDLQGKKTFKLIPWIVGLYEFQLYRMDEEFARMCEEYKMHWGAQFVAHGPAFLQVIPVEKEITVKQEALTYEQVSFLIDKSNSFMLNPCICKKERRLLGKPCDRPEEICLAMDPNPGFYENHPRQGKIISREQAYQVLQQAEEAGLVHLTNNQGTGQWFICNCCSCCCAGLQAVKMGFIPNMVNSHYYAQIDPEACDACGTCADERCQVNAIEAGDESYLIVKEKCIGCGLCLSTCQSEAIKLIRKNPEELTPPPNDEQAWLEERARRRGVDYSHLK